MILPRRSLVRLGAAALFALALVPAVPNRTEAHDIPSRVTVLAFIKPRGHALHVVIRVPLEAMRDVNFPLHGPGYLDVDAAESLAHDAARVWLADDIRIHENDQLLGAPRIMATRISLPSDQSFRDFDSAIVHVSGPALPRDTELPWKQAMLDVVLEYRIASDVSQFSVDPALARLGIRTTSVLRFLPPHGPERAFEYIGNPGLVHLDPRWQQAALRFVRLGFDHILDGIDHLLFILCLVIPFRRIRPLVAIITSFTVAHSITLIASALGFAPGALWFPPLIEVLIALSIVYMALENIIGARLERRWLFAFGFGLVHGFGFSFALRETMQFAGSHLVTSLLSFNLGVELGQLLVIVVAVPALSWAFRHVVAERMGTIILSAFVAHTAWHWMLDRGATLREYRLEAPVLDAAFAASGMRALMLVLIVGGAAWLMFELYSRLVQRGSEQPAAAAE